MRGEVEVRRGRKTTSDGRRGEAPTDARRRFEMTPVGARGDLQRHLSRYAICRSPFGLATPSAAGYNIGHDVVWVFSDGLRSRINSDSAIFLFGPSLHTVKMLMRKQLVMSVCSFGWQVVMWSPRGVSGFLCRASRRCSLNLSRTLRLVSPM